MKRWAYQYQQKALVGGCVTDGVVCPRPRRVGVVVPLHFHDPIRPPSPRLLHLKNRTSGYYSDDEVIKYDDQGNFQVGSSPPYYSGSPPTRASNPVIQYEQFGNDNTLSSSSSSSRRNGSGVPPRIEGFNCRGHCSISSVA
ncbi:hypothetical protein BUALT_Bualt02G0075800 [Buddleja alternifolia]|uniref:Uncharacterized protein n=1 Tax=Buddleja alternifolia TaxID=168488 RepID=A0AAV6XZV9_9LAMI|nr:hypothetical protein BUALT_Bualt02G0075800 [Buddleja alternifolia]